jgi:hypothetical protein
MESRAPLTELPIGAIKPEGWLRDQLEIQADGLTGHLDELWPDVGPASAWLGGNGEDWERGPYYLDGLVPLAYTLGNEALVGKVRNWVEAILRSQKADGYFGPTSNPDWWPRMVALKALAQYFDATADSRILDFMERYFANQRRELPSRPLTDWGRARGQDNALAIYWLADRRPSAQYADVAEELLHQSINWGRYLTEELIQAPATVFDHHTHVVNDASFTEQPTIINGLARFERVWSSGDQVELELPLRVSLVTRPSGGCGVELGPWIMALSPGEIWERIPGSTGFGDYEVRARYSWNYGVLPIDPEKSRPLFGPLSSPPFQVGWLGRRPVAPVMLEVTGRLLSDWPIAAASAGRIPAAPHSHSPEQKLFLVPYGSTRIRIAEFPVLTS